MRLIDADALTQDIWDSGITNRDEFEDLVRNSKTIEAEEASKAFYPLKMCPFCGNKAVFEIRESRYVKCVNVVCDTCGCQTKLFSDSDDPELENPSGKAFKKAAKSWNRRRYTGT